MNTKNMKKCSVALLLALVLLVSTASPAKADFPVCPAGDLGPNATIESWGPTAVLGAFILAGAYIGYAAWWVQNNVIYVAY